MRRVQGFINAPSAVSPFSAGQNNRYGQPALKWSKFMHFTCTLTTADVGSIHVDTINMNDCTNVIRKSIKKDLSNEKPFLAYLMINTVVMVKIAAKTKDTTKLIPEPTTSLRLVWTFFQIRSLLLLLIQINYKCCRKIYKQ
jgi:hypothetical protein